MYICVRWLLHCSHRRELTFSNVFHSRKTHIGLEVHQCVQKRIGQHQTTGIPRIPLRKQWAHLFVSGVWDSVVVLGCNGKHTSSSSEDRSPESSVPSRLCRDCDARKIDSDQCVGELVPLRRLSGTLFSCQHESIILECCFCVLCVCVIVMCVLCAVCVYVFCAIRCYGFGVSTLNTPMWYVFVMSPLLYAFMLSQGIIRLDGLDPMLAWASVSVCLNICTDCIVVTRCLCLRMFLGLHHRTHYHHNVGEWSTLCVGEVHVHIHIYLNTVWLSCWLFSLSNLSMQTPVLFVCIFIFFHSSALSSQTIGRTMVFKRHPSNSGWSKPKKRILRWYMCLSLLSFARNSMPRVLGNGSTAQLKVSRMDSIIYSGG